MRPVLYGMAELSPSAIDIFLKVYLLIYFNKILGLSATTTSLVIGLGVFWDAMIDPWIGAVSDRYYKNHGQRKLILNVACFAVSLLFFLLWRIPATDHFLTYLALFILTASLNSALSFFSVPYYAVANDLEKDNQKRKTWIGSRLIFYNLGTITGLSVPAYFLTRTQNVSDPRLPYLQSTSVMIALMISFSLLAAYCMYYKKPIRKTNPLDPPHRPMKLSDIWKDKTFCQLLLAFFVVNCGLGANSSLALYYYKDFLKFTEAQTQTILITFLIVFTLSIPIWAYLTRFFDKKKLIISGALTLGLITVTIFPIFDGSPFWLVLVTASLVGGFLVGVAVVMEIYLSDFLNHKEHVLKISVAGQFLGLWKMSSKISRSVAIALAGPIIEFSTGKPQVLAQFFGWGVGLFFIISAFVIMIPIHGRGKT